MPKSATATKDALKGVKKTGSIHLLVLMDESGSMGHLQEAVVTGCNEFLHGFRKNKAARAWVAFFDAHPGADRTRFKVKAQKIADVAELGIADYSPRGMTPLNDAILDALSALDARVAKNETVFMAIITDGLENASEASAQTVASAIAKFEKRGWAFVYLGANQHAETSAAMIGLAKKGQAFNFAATQGGITSTLRSTGALAQSHSINYAAHGAGGQSLAATLDSAAALYNKTGGVIPEAEEDDAP